MSELKGDKFYQEVAEQRLKVALSALDNISSLKRQRDSLMVACKAAYKEGYVDGYADGIKADESCVPETTYFFKNDFKKAWDKSDTRAALNEVNGEK